MSRGTSGTGSRARLENGEKKHEQTTNGHQPTNHKKEESSSSDDDGESLHIPTQLKLEFVNSIMFRQWALAKKLCQFMLMYEPDNNEAKQYAPLIDYMLTQEESSSSDDDDDDDDDSSADSSSSSSASADEVDKQPDTAPVQTPKAVNSAPSHKCSSHK